MMEVGVWGACVRGACDRGGVRVSAKGRVTPLCTLVHHATRRRALEAVIMLCASVRARPSSANWRRAPAIPMLAPRVAMTTSHAPSSAALPAKQNPEARPTVGTWPDSRPI